MQGNAIDRKLQINKVEIMVKEKTKCTCGQELKITCLKCSKLKMVILFNRLKPQLGNGDFVSPVFGTII